MALPFDATAGTTTSNKKMAKASNRIAADLADILADPTKSRQMKEDLLEQIAALVANPEAAEAFAAGNFSQTPATASDGSPALALGSGSSSSTTTTPAAVTPLQALQIILTAPDTEVPADRKQLLMRALAPVGDPQRIPVEADGTPSEIATLRGRVSALTTQLTTAQSELANERDKTVAGSLAQRLDAASGTTTVIPPDMVSKAVIRTKVDALRPLATASKAATSSAKSVVTMPLADLVDAYRDLRSALS